MQCGKITTQRREESANKMPEKENDRLISSSFAYLYRWRIAIRAAISSKLHFTSCQLVALNNNQLRILNTHTQRGSEEFCFCVCHVMFIENPAFH